jgi:hypothetical protein
MMMLALKRSISQPERIAPARGDHEVEFGQLVLEVELRPVVKRCSIEVIHHEKCCARTPAAAPCANSRPKVGPASPAAARVPQAAKQPPRRQEV